MSDLRQRITDALVREHYRRAAERIEASPEDHQAAFADVVMAEVEAERDAEVDRLRKELSQRTESYDRTIEFANSYVNDYAQAVYESEVLARRLYTAWWSARIGRAHARTASQAWWDSSLDIAAERDRLLDILVIQVGLHRDNPAHKNLNRRGCQTCNAYRDLADSDAFKAAEARHFAKIAEALRTGTYIACPAPEDQPGAEP